VAPYLHLIAIDDIILSGDLSRFTWWVPLFVVVTVATYLFQYVQVYQMRVVGENVVAKMRDDMMSKQQVISLRYFSEGETGRIMSRLINDANRVRIFIRQGFTQILVDTTSILGALIVVFALNVRLATIAVAILPVAVVAGWILGEYSRRAYRRSLVVLAGLTAKTQEDLAGMKVTQAYAQEKETEKKFLKSQDENVKATIRAILIGSSYTPFVMALRLTGTFIILYFGVYALFAGTIPLGILVAFIEYQFSYFMPLVDLVTMYDQYQSTMSAIERMFDVIDTKVDVVDASPGRSIALP